MKILIVEDEQDALVALEIILTSQGHEVLSAGNGCEALDLLQQSSVDVVISDIMMPEMDGFELCRLLKLDEKLNAIPFIFHTASYVKKQDEQLAMELGASSFLIKPAEPEVLAEAIQTATASKASTTVHVEGSGQQLKLIAGHRDAVARKLEEKLNELEREKAALHDSFVESIHTLMRAAEYRDDETGAHVKRISYYTKTLAEQMGLDSDFCELIFYASPMHDIGKIGIPDHILLKPGGFEADEWEIMKSHTVIGGSILSGNSSPYLQMGEQIALNHHERWDGGGYPNGLKGESIPLAARIMQLADVYDALRSRRPYKPAFDQEKTFEIITKGDGRTDPSHFDPQVLSAFDQCADQWAEIFSQLSEQSEK